MSWGIQGSYKYNDSIPRFDDGPHTYVKIKDSNIQNWDCGNFIMLSDNQYTMYIFTENLTVHNNKFNFALIEKSHFSDTGSKFVSNTPKT